MDICPSVISRGSLSTMIEPAPSLTVYVADSISRTLNANDRETASPLRYVSICAITHRPVLSGYPRSFQRCLWLSRQFGCRSDEDPQYLHSPQSTPVLHE